MGKKDCGPVALFKWAGAMLAGNASTLANECFGRHVWKYGMLYQDGKFSIQSNPNVFIQIKQC